MGAFRRWWRRGTVVVLEQDAVRRAVQVVELARLQGPKEGGETDQAEEQGDGDEIEQDGHARFPRLRRKALVITTMDDVDMATAAIKGVTKPAMASGMVTAL